MTVSIFQSRKDLLATIERLEREKAAVEETLVRAVETLDKYANALDRAVTALEGAAR